MEKTTSEKIVMNINKLGNVIRKAGKPEDRFEGPRPPMGPGPGPAGPSPISLESRILILLKEVKELHKPQMGMILGVPPKVSGKIVDKLVEEGKVCLNINPDDPKKSSVSITEKGLAKLDQEREEKRQQAETILKNLTDEEKETLLELLEKIK